MKYVFRLRISHEISEYPFSISVSDSVSSSPSRAVDVLFRHKASYPTIAPLQSAMIQTFNYIFTRQLMIHEVVVILNAETEIKVT